MSTHNNEEPPPWFLQALQQRLPKHFSVSQALREAMHFGMELERAKHTHTWEPELCRKHLARLRQIAPGIWRCPFQHLHIVPRRPVPQDTGPLPRRVMPAKRYILERQEDRGRIEMEETQMLPIIKKEEPQ